MIMMMKKPRSQPFSMERKSLKLQQSLHRTEDCPAHGEELEE
jgi:hypothetical protein